MSCHVRSNIVQRPGLWEGWEIEFLLPGLGRIFCINTANVQKLNRNTKAEGLFPNPTFPKPMLHDGRNAYERLIFKGIPNNTTRHFCLIGIWKLIEVLLIELRSLKFVKGWKNNFECCGSGIGIKFLKREGFSFRV